MANEVDGKVKLNIDSSAFEKAIAEAVGRGFSKSLAPVEERFEKAFSKGSVRKNLASNLSGGDLKTADKRNALLKKYESIQSKINALNGKDNKSLKDKASILALSTKQATVGMKGMTAGMNPYIMALKAGVEAAKKLYEQIQKINEESKKFVGQGSLFTDKQTMDMMQKTGQTATQAQGTQRALDQLGLSFDDLQSGKLTEAQAKAFEEIRQRELNKLEEISKASEGMFKNVRQITLAINLLTQDITDWITIAFAESEGFNNLIEDIKGFVSEVAPVIKEVIGLITPILDALSKVFSFVLKVVKGLLPIVSSLALLAEGVLGIISGALEVLIPILEIVANLISKIAGWLNTIISTVMKGLNSVWRVIADLINGVLDLLAKIPIIGKNFENSEVNRDLFRSTSLEHNNVNNNEFTNNYIYGDSTSNGSHTQNNNLFTNEFSLVDN